MTTITISDKAAKMIEDIRRNNGEHKGFICEAMQHVINLILDTDSGLTIDVNNFYPLVYLSNYQELRDALVDEDFKTA